MDGAGTETDLNGQYDNGTMTFSAEDDKMIDKSLWDANQGLGERGAGGVYPEQDGQGDQNCIDTNPDSR